MEPTKFRAYLEAEEGKRSVDLWTVPPSRQGERTDKGEGTSSDDRKKSGHDKTAKLRAILRAPESAQALYREGRLTQATAAKLGPVPKKEPEARAEQARKVAQAEQALADLDRQLPAREFRRRAEEAVAGVLGSPVASPLDLLKRAWARASKAEREAFIEWVGTNGGEL